MHFRTSIKHGLISSLSAVSMFINPILSYAADPIEDKAQSGIANYVVIMAISKLCKFDIEKPIQEAVVANINALMPKAKFSDKDMDDVLSGSLAELSKTKDKFCSPGIDVFYQQIPAFEKIAVAAADGTGVSLKPIPARAVAPAPVADKGREEALKQLNIALMIEAISEECSIKLKDGESLEIDRVEYFWRGKADYSAKQFADLQAFWEADAKKNHDKVCAKTFAFRTIFEKSLATIK